MAKSPMDLSGITTHKPAPDPGFTEQEEAAIRSTANYFCGKICAIPGIDKLDWYGGDNSTFLVFPVFRASAPIFAAGRKSKPIARVAFIVVPFEGFVNDNYSSCNFYLEGVSVVDDSLRSVWDHGYDAGWLGHLMYQLLPKSTRAIVDSLDKILDEIGKVMSDTEEETAERLYEYMRKPEFLSEFKTKPFKVLSTANLSKMFLMDEK